MTIIIYNNTLNNLHIAEIKYIFGQVVPLWYQELSYRQMEAANCLTEAAEEDLDEGTVNRTFECLRGIGIKPIVNKRIIRLALVESHGNNIALLWMLMQIHYSADRTKDKIGS